MTNVTNRDRYPTGASARRAYARWADGCLVLHWCLIPYDEWLESADRSDEMLSELRKARAAEAGITAKGDDIR